MALSTSTSTANPELDSTSFKSASIEEAALLVAQQAQLDCIYARLASNSYGTPEYWNFCEKYISPDYVNKVIYDFTRTRAASANEVRQFVADQTRAKKSTKIYEKKGQNCIPIPRESSTGIKIRWVTLSKKKPPEQSNKKKSTAIVEVAVLIFLLLCLNGAFFWSLIFGLLTH